jgi:exopolyphosphatase/guanosine-5'-triphosphate,3'-diphosphate pyrophosphatase
VALFTRPDGGFEQAEGPELTPRLAAIDLGSNTIRLLVADADATNGLRPVHGEQVVARLGQGLARSGVLALEAMERALTAVRAYRDRARGLGAGRVLVVATAALRQARNRDEFLGRLAAEAGVVARVASGVEEARLTLLGVASALPPPAGVYVVLDIGGGSTELIVAGGGRSAGAVSLTLGCVGLVERFLRADPVDWAEYAACAAHVAGRLAAEAWPEIRPLGPRLVVGTAGTITTLAALDLGLTAYDAARVQGHRLAVGRIEALLHWLGALPLAERARLPGLEPGRADLIIPGIAVTLGVLAGLDLPELLVSDSGLREGILLDAVGWAPPAGVAP